jgi:hypothetical protein
MTCFVNLFTFISVQRWQNKRVGKKNEIIIECKLKRLSSYLIIKYFWGLTACQKIVQQRLTPLAPPSAGVVSGAAAQRPTTPNHYSLGRHYGQQQQQHSTGSTTSITTGVGGSVGGVSVGPPTSHGGYPGAVSGFSSSSLSSVVAGSTLGPAGAGSIGTGHSSLAGYNNNVGGSALSGSALNLHSSSSSSSNAASLSTNGALAARGMKAIPPPPSSPARH